MKLLGAHHRAPPFSNRAPRRFSSATSPAKARIRPRNAEQQASAPRRSSKDSKPFSRASVDTRTVPTGTLKERPEIEPRSSRTDVTGPIDSATPYRQPLRLSHDVAMPSRDERSSFPYAVSDLREAASPSSPRFRSGGALALRLSRLSEPSAAESLAMLRAFREHSKLSVAAVGALLGASYASARAWCSGRRTPSRAARRSIWLLHRLSVRPDAPLGLDDWMTWN